MHIRVLLSKYRAYTPCPTCEGARLKPDALLWRLGTKQDADQVFGSLQAIQTAGRQMGRGPARRAARSHHARPDAAADRALPQRSSTRLHLPAPLDEATDLLLTEIRARLSYLCQVGLAYLTLDRQSRTLSGGEVQRINLTTALGTSLVNTLFVLDEPSIGLHPRDMGRVIEVMHRLRDAGNSLVVVEHDPQIMFAADRMLDMGPGPGERGGEVVSFGTPAELKAAHSLTAEYLSGRKRADARRGAEAARSASGPRLRTARRRRAQPEEHRRRHPARAPGLHHRRVRLGQIDAGAGRAVCGAAESQGPAHRDAGRAPRARRRRADRRRGDGGPVAHRPDHALQPGELRRRLRRHPQAVRARARGERARLHRRHLQLQLRATAAARPAAATASSTSKCSSCPTCTCAAPTATAGASATRCWR